MMRQLIKNLVQAKVNPAMMALWLTGSVVTLIAISSCETTSTHSKAKSQSLNKPQKAEKISGAQAAPKASVVPEVKPPSHRISYHVAANTKVYELKKTRGQHLAIKVTPPKNFGSAEVIFVEIYNETKSHLGQVDFDLILTDEGYFNYEGHINGDDLLPGHSAVRKVAVGAGKGAFGPVSKVVVANLKLYDNDANQLGLRVFVDLVR